MQIFTRQALVNKIFYEVLTLRWLGTACKLFAVSMRVKLSTESVAISTLFCAIVLTNFTPLAADRAWDRGGHGCPGSARTMVGEGVRGEAGVLVGAASTLSRSTSKAAVWQAPTTTIGRELRTNLAVRRSNGVQPALLQCSHLSTAMVGVGKARLRR
jgi:hypothetical protein